MGHGAVRREVMRVVNEVYQRAEVFLFGRWTFELFAGY
jgi:hypothetical protein